MTTFEPVPKNLREQIVQRIATMSEQDLAELYELWLLKEKMDVRRQMSEQTERENAAGVWADLPELVRAYRARNKDA